MAVILKKLKKNLGTHNLYKNAESCSVSFDKLGAQFENWYRQDVLYWMDTIRQSDDKCSHIRKFPERTDQ